MRAEIIFTGTELLLGQVLNTHAQYLGRELSALGIGISRHTTVGDDWDELRKVLREALERAELVITTGGLGPTTDDITLAAIADVLGLPLVLNETVLSWIEEYFAKRNQPVPENLTRQAYFPAGATLLPNAAGTAPGCVVEKNNRTVIALPGPPHELMPMFETHVMPFLASRLSAKGTLYFRVVKVTGLAEFAVQNLLRNLEGREKVRLGYIAKPGEVHVRIAAEGCDAAEARELVTGMVEEVHARLGDFIFAYDEECIEDVTGKLLRAKGYTVAVAESCTGGLLSARLTDIPGSSAYFMGGVVAYDNETKKRILGVREEILREKGAVSFQTAVAMAEGVRRLLSTDAGIGITGIAGPSGGTPEKPVGLVYVAVAVPGKTVVKKYLFSGGRFAVRQGAANAALKMLRDLLESG